MARLRYNGLVAQIGTNGLGTSETAITFVAALTHSGGVAVPTIGAGDYIPLTILDANKVPKERVNLTAYTAGALTGTIARAQEGFAAAAHNASAVVINADTATDFEWVASIVAGANITVNATDPRNPIVSASGTPTESFESAVTALPNKVHRWKWDEASGATVTDVIGTLNLTLSGTYTRAAVAKDGTNTATAFNVGKAVSTGLGSIPVGDAARCIIIAIKSDQNGLYTPFSYGSGATRAWFTPQLNNGDSQSLRLLTFGDDMNIANTVGVDRGQWHLAAFGYAGQQVTYAYLDGDLFAHRQAGVLATSASSGMTVCGTHDGSTSEAASFVGSVDDMIVLSSWPGRALLDRLARAYGVIG